MWPKKVSRFTSAIRQAMADMYLAGASCQQVARTFETDKGTVCRMLKSIGIDRRSMSKAKRKYSIKENVFERVEDEETAYWLGFLYADGCVYERRNDGQKGLNVILQDRDIDHIQKFSTFIGGGLPIKHDKRYNTSGIYIYSIKLANDLINWGCIPNKSEALLRLPKLPSALLLHFIRGYFDGDGSAFDTNCPTLEFCGSEIFLLDIKEHIGKEIGEYGFMKSHSKSHVHYLIYRGVYKANIIGKRLYQDATIYLGRKYDNIQNFSLPKRKRAKVGTVRDMSEETVKKYIELGQGP